MRLKTCKSVCNECPFKKDSLKGFLGDHSLESILECMDKEGLFSCHMERKNDETLNQILIESGKQSICRGFLISSLKSWKSFGKNPLTGLELLKLQRQIPYFSVEVDAIMNKNEFEEHHKL